MRDLLFRGQTRKKGEKVFMDGRPGDANWVYAGIIQGKGDFSVSEEESRVSGGAFYFSCKSQLIGNILKRETKRLSG